MALSVKLGARLDQKLRDLAEQMQCSRHFLMCEAIRIYVETEEMKRFQAQDPMATEALSPLDDDRSRSFQA